MNSTFEEKHFLALLPTSRERNMETLIEKFNTATAPGPDRVTAGAVIASATLKGAHRVPFKHSEKH